MTEPQRNQLQHAAWQKNQATIWTESEPYSLAKVMYRQPRHKVPAVVWWLLAAATLATLIIF
jgi:hypothetical protein